jgi:hypothetical protein
MSDRNDTTGAEAMAEDLFGGGGEPMAPTAGAQDAVAQGYEHTPGVGKGTEGTVLDPAMGGNPVTPEDIPPGPNASSGGQTGGSTPTQSEGASGHRGFDPGRAYTGGDIDPNEIGGVGGVLGGLGVPSTNVSSGVSGMATGGRVGGTAASPGSGTAGGIGGSTAGASGIQTVAGGGAVGGPEADVSASAGGHGGLGAGIDQDANVGSPTSSMGGGAGSRLGGTTGETGNA